jgi:hypothetical protein
MTTARLQRLLGIVLEEFTVLQACLDDPKTVGCSELDEFLSKLVSVCGACASAGTVQDGKVGLPRFAA